MSRKFKKITNPFNDPLRKFHYLIGYKPLVESNLKEHFPIKGDYLEVKCILKIDKNLFRRETDSESDFDLGINLEKRRELLTELYPFKNYIQNKPIQKSMNYVSNLYRKESLKKFEQFY